MKVFRKTGLTGGTSNDLDGIDGSTLVDQQFAFVYDEDDLQFKPYILDATSGATADGELIIAPAVNPGTKRWVLYSLYSKYANDLNLDGNYLLDTQNFPDLLAKGPGYWFDQIDDKITVSDNDNISFGNGTTDTPFSIIANIQPDDITRFYMAFKGVGSTNREYCFALNAQDKLQLLLEDDGVSAAPYRLADSAETSLLPATYGASYDGGGGATAADGIVLYKNGKVVPSTATNDGSYIAMENEGSDLFIGNNGASDWASGAYFSLRMFNLELSAAEMKAFSTGGPIPYKYRGASNDEIVTDGDFPDFANWTESGTWTVVANKARVTGNSANNDLVQDLGLSTFVNKTFRIKFTTSSSTNIEDNQFRIRGASGNYLLPQSVYTDDDGVQLSDNGVHIITVTPTNINTAAVLRFRLDSSATDGGLDIDDISVTQIGCVLDLDESGVTDTQWLDNSGNSLHGAVSEAKVVNRPVQKIVQQNLLTNTEWIANSQSTLENVGSAKWDDDASSDDTGNAAYTWSNWTPSFDTDHYVGTENGGVNGFLKVQLSGLTVGASYKASIDLQNGTYALDSGDVFRAQTSTSVVIESTTLSSSPGSYTTFTVTWEATETNNAIAISIVGMGSGETLLIDNILVYEVTPGYVAADNKAPDGWYKDSTLDVYREHSGTNTKDGSFYALKVVSTSTDDFILWPSDFSEDEAHIKRFAGETVTFGCWVKASAIGDVKLGYYTGSYNYSPANTKTDWEWMEYSIMVPTGATQFSARVFITSAGKTAYISQPMLIFGDHIGEGNYSRPPGEVIWFENSVVPSNLLNGLLSQSDVSFTTINLEADSNGRIGKGVKAVYFYADIRDSGSAGSTGLSPFIQFRGETDHIGPILTTAGLPNDTKKARTDVVALTSDGDFQYNIDATGSGTLDVNSFYYIGIQTR